MPASNKLTPLAATIAQLLETRFGAKASYTLEHKLEWLGFRPSERECGEFWEPICTAYNELRDGQCTLSEALTAAGDSARTGLHKVDAWFHKPYSFAFEYDESQHFNQFRLITLRTVGVYNKLPIDLSGYKSECQRHHVKPGKSGFCLLKSYDPLFPPVLPGEAQDNRVRQRAFRDLLKDLIPHSMKSTNPTWRIGSYVLNGKTKGFTSLDCETVAAHVKHFGFLSHIELRA